MECKDIINNAIIANNSNKTKYDVELIKDLSKIIRDSKNLFTSAEDIDIKNNNGFHMDFDVVERILNRYEKRKALINTERSVKKTEEVLMSKLYDRLGIVLVLFDGNPYILLEMILLGLLTHNTMIFSYEGYMKGTNGFILTLVQSILEKENCDPNTIQLFETNDNKEFFNNFKTIDKTIVIGDNLYIDKYLKECSTEVQVSGYNNYDLYIDSLEHKDVIDKILKQDLNISVYINSELDFDYDNAMIVNDIEEAISYINYNGSGYSSAIFTNNNENASQFMKEVKSKNVMVNASPTLEQALDIKEEDLLREKNVVIPDIYKLDGSRIEV